MKKLRIERNFSLLEDYKYNIYIDNALTYTAHKEPDLGRIDKFIPQLIGLTMTILVKDLKEDTILTIKKNPPTPFYNNNFRVVTSNYRYSIRDGNNFSIPDLDIVMGKRILNIGGQIRKQEFSIGENSHTLVRILGEFIENGKTYHVDIEEDFENSTFISIASSIIIDTLYADY